MYKQILLPIELGDAEDCRRAVDAANLLLDETGKITLLHAIEPIPTYAKSYFPPNFKIESQAAVQQQLDDIAKTHKIDDKALVFGAAGRCIVDWAKENSVDCIVLASHRPALSDVFLGSTAAWVVRHTQSNVHILR